MQHLLRLFLVGCLSLVLESNAFALTFNLPLKGNDIVGEVQWTQVKMGDDLSQIGQRYDIGYYELIEANPNINPDELIVGEILVIPSQFILPAVERKGIVVNLAELRIYYYPPGKNKVMTFPIGIGRDGNDTPVGKLSLIEKTANPTWYVPDSIRKDQEENGIKLPKFIPPGPTNPLGKYRLRLSRPTYLIHGTNDIRGIGRRSTSGCMRLFPNDIELLFSEVKVGMPVQIINETYKAGWLAGRLYLEAHKPTEEKPEAINNDKASLHHIITRAIQGHTGNFNQGKTDQAAALKNGIPSVIGKEDTLQGEKVEEVIDLNNQVQLKDQIPEAQPSID